MGGWASDQTGECIATNVMVLVGGVGGGNYHGPVQQCCKNCFRKADKGDLSKNTKIYHDAGHVPSSCSSSASGATRKLANSLVKAMGVPCYLRRCIRLPHGGQITGNRRTLFKCR